ARGRAWGKGNGTRSFPGAVLLLRPVPGTLSVLLAALAAAAPLAAQAVERTDVPAAGRLRLSFDPKIEAWDDAFWSGTRRQLGWFLSGDSVGRAIPAVT